MVGVSLVPAFGTLYQRLTLPESTRFVASQKLRGEEADADAAIEELKKAQAGEQQLYNKARKDDEKNVDANQEGVEKRSGTGEDDSSAENLAPEVLAAKKAHFSGSYKP